MASDGPEERAAGWWSRRWAIAACFAALVVVAFALYAGSLRNEFVWDDPIVLGQQLQVFHSLHDIFFPPPRIPQFGRFYYRPLIVVSYVIDRYLWGDTPFGFHFPVVLFHALNTGFVFLLGRRLFGSGQGAFLAALAGGLLFAAHPIHTESVCWMAGRSDTMAAMFLLPSFLAYLAWKRRRDRWWQLGVAALLFLVALFAKESASSLLILVVASDILGVDRIGAAGGETGQPKGSAARSAQSAPPAGNRNQKDTTGATARATQGRDAGRASASKAAAGRRSVEPGSRANAQTSRAGRQKPAAARSAGSGLPWRGWLSMCAAVATYAYVRSQALGKEADPFRAQDPDPIASMRNLVRAIGFYISKIFVPSHLDAYIPNIPNPGFSLVLGLAGLAVAAAATWLALRYRDRISAFLIIWFFAALAPSLAIAYFVISEAPVAERYLYLPSAGFCLLIGYLAFVKLPAAIPAPARRAVLAGAGVAVVALSVVYANATIGREKIWKSDEAFWKDGVEKSPNEGLPHLHLGLVYANQKKDDLAEKEYLIAIDPTVEYDVEGRSTALNNLGMLFMGRRSYDKAEVYFEQAIQMRSDYPTPYYGVGITSMRRAEQATGPDGSARSAYAQKAERYLRRAIELNPQYVKAHNQLAYLLVNSGRAAESLQHLDRVLALVSHGNEYDFAADLKRQIAARQGRAAPQ